MKPLKVHPAKMISAPPRMPRVIWNGDMPIANNPPAKV
jgi:hypothetical protein